MASPLENWIPGLDPLTGTLTLPLWAAGAVAALFVVFCALALNRAGREGIAGGTARIALILVGAVLAWFLLEGTTRPDTAAERRALEARAGVLATRATMPGSPLACLDAMAGDTVERSCERTLFATPEAMASAVSYAATQLNLFADVSEFVNRGHAGLEPLLASLRRAVETDRYGLVAHVLATRDSCTAEQCPPLAMMRDASRLSANLKQRTYDFYVGRHSSVWPAPAAGPVASASPPSMPGAPGMQPMPQGASASPGVAVRPNGELFFPSSDSIPPVNIMTAEPGAQNETTGSAPARTPPKRPAQKDQQPKAQKDQQSKQQQQAPIDLNTAARNAPVTAQ
ncbi:MAG: hypothetical protein K2Y71_10950 [Xanthobacteraceae bacterium]|nr:hypothetical protein [Xanthobacteraceae bacterium]